MIIYNWTFVIKLLKHILTALKNIPTHYCGRPGHSLWPDFVFLNFNWICPHTFKIHSATLFSLRKSFTHFNFILCSMAHFPFTSSSTNTFVFQVSLPSLLPHVYSAFLFPLQVLSSQTSHHNQHHLPMGSGFLSSHVAFSENHNIFWTTCCYSLIDLYIMKTDPLTMVFVFTIISLEPTVLTIIK